MHITVYGYKYEFSEGTIHIKIQPVLPLKAAPTVLIVVWCILNRAVYLCVGYFNMPLSNVSWWPRQSTSLTTCFSSFLCPCFLFVCVYVVVAPVVAPPLKFSSSNRDGRRFILSIAFHLHSRSIPATLGRTLTHTHTHTVQIRRIIINHHVYIYICISSKNVNEISTCLNLITNILRYIISTVGVVAFPLLKVTLPCRQKVEWARAMSTERAKVMNRWWDGDSHPLKERRLTNWELITTSLII